jgi:hypothetical protein
LCHLHDGFEILTVQRTDGRTLLATTPKGWFSSSVFSRGARPKELYSRQGLTFDLLHTSSLDKGARSGPWCSPDGSVMKGLPAGGSPVVFARGYNDPDVIAANTGTLSALALDATSVYWLTQGRRQRVEDQGAVGSRERQIDERR